LQAASQFRSTAELIGVYGSDLEGLRRRLAELQALLVETGERWAERIARKAAADRALTDREVAGHLERLRQIEGKPIGSQSSETGDRKLDAGLAVAAKWAQIREVEARKEGLVKAHERKMAELTAKLAHEMRMLEDDRDRELKPIQDEIAELQALIGALEGNGPIARN
jgi:hypothetical protein